MFFSSECGHFASTFTRHHGRSIRHHNVNENYQDGSLSADACGVRCVDTGTDCQSFEFKPGRCILNYLSVKQAVLAGAFNVKEDYDLFERDCSGNLFQ